MNYRLGIDLGTTSLGWAIFRLDDMGRPCALIKAGVRIFSDGREAAKNGGVGAPLAVQRRTMRGLRRRRDRMLKRKQRLMKKLIEHGFFPADRVQRKALEKRYPNPYALRAIGMERALLPEEFGRALFHLNQRRGFQSNRKLDRAAVVELSDSDDGGAQTAKPAKSADEASKMKAGISTTRRALQQKGMTAGQWLYEQMKSGLPVRNRQRLTQNKKGEDVVEASYERSFDRQSIADEFDALWAKQAGFNPTLFNEKARDDLRDTLLYQRKLRPVEVGRCTLLPDEERAPLALPSSQRFRILQEINNLKVVDQSMQMVALTPEQRRKVFDALERNGKRTFDQLRKLLGISGAHTFNLEDAKRGELKGNASNVALGKKDRFGEVWHAFDDEKQDEIVLKLLNEESEADLVEWLVKETGVDDRAATRIANASLPEGYGNLSHKALKRIVPVLKEKGVVYSEAVQLAGFPHHSKLDFHYEASEVDQDVDPETGEIRQVVFKQLPYYGKALHRHVAFGSGKETDSDEKRYGKIANPTVHIGLNQVRKVINELIRTYGRPAEAVVELARELKQSKAQRDAIMKEQAENEKRAKRIAEQLQPLLNLPVDDIRKYRKTDIRKWILWEELSKDAADRRCPYSGKQISAEMLISGEVEIEHILPFSRTLDDGMNNKTVSLRDANRVKGNRTPWEARADFEARGWKYEDILARARQMPNRRKAQRFAENGYEKWLGDEKGFIARALNDTRYLARIAKEYIGLVCPGRVSVVTGSLTANLRHHLGLNQLLSGSEEKNRNDHRHHALDACVIGITDPGLLKAFADANVRAHKKGVDQLVSEFEPPWPTYRAQVERAIGNIWVSHRPDHGYEGAMLEDTAHGIGKDGSIHPSRSSSKASISHVNRISEPGQEDRHGVDAEGKPLPYKGYVGGSNYCIEIFRNDKGKWEGDVISTFQAYQIVRQARREGLSHQDAVKKLRNPHYAQNGRPLVMRLMIDDIVRMRVDAAEGQSEHATFRLVKISGNGQVFFAPHNEANVAARHADKGDPFSYTSKYAGSLQKAEGRAVTISPIGVLHDPGFSGKK